MNKNQHCNKLQGLFTRLHALCYCKKGQLGPQALEDLPMAILAFLVAIGAVIVLLNIVAGDLDESGTIGIHKAGKRLAESFSSELFSSDVSRSFGPTVLDKKIISKFYSEDSQLTGRLGHIEYGFWAKISSSGDSWEFGQSPPKTTLSYFMPVSILDSDSLKNGEVVVRIWKK